MNRKAVLCGINRYKTQTALRGCLNDLKNMYQILTETFEFEADQIHILRDEEVTKDVIWQEWQWLIQGASPGDQLFFHFSGHGSYVTDNQIDEEEDGYDEITCLYDMDFNDTGSFVRDDEWNTLIQEVPTDVELTVIMDTCHSGTGTRNFMVKLNGRQKSIAIDGNSSSRSLKEIAQLDNNYLTLIDDERVVLPRFLVPPIKIQEQRRIISHRSTSITPPQSKNVLVVTACRADQTAADAYFDQDFHGAFTYYFCQQLRQSPHQSSQTLINAVKQSLLTNQFLQEPQHEGANRITGLLSTTAKTEPCGCSASNQRSSNFLKCHPMESFMPSKQLLTSDNQSLLIEAYTKLLDTISNSTSIHNVSRVVVEGDRQTQNRYLVYVHGISRHEVGYSNGWWNSLKPHVREVFGSGALNSSRKEVLWSDLVNARSHRNDDVDPIEKQQFQLQIEAVLNERQRQIILEAAQKQGGDPSAIRTRTLSRARELVSDDFLIYMLNPAKRQEIIDRFTKVVWPLLQTDSRVDIISHSWGTVVAYEGLRELENYRGLQGRVSNFFTVGSALSIWPVWLNLRAENKNGRRPSMVDRWINLDAEGDIVGGTLRDKFEVAQESLNLKPGSCEKRLFGYDAACAHSSYFSANNVAVNRDIFARYILR